MCFLDLSSADLCDALAGLDRSRQRDQVRSFMTYQRLANFLAEAGYDVHDAWRKLSKYFGKRKRRQRRFLARLDDHSVSRSQRRRDFPRQEKQRVIPGNDGRDNAVRFFDREIYLVLEN